MLYYAHVLLEYKKYIKLIYTYLPMSSSSSELPTFSKHKDVVRSGKKSPSQETGLGNRRHDTRVFLNVL